jgi:hypothetical protein
LNFFSEIKNVVVKFGISSSKFNLKNEKLKNKFCRKSLQIPRIVNNILYQQMNKIPLEELLSQKLIHQMKIVTIQIIMLQVPCELFYLIKNYSINLFFEVNLNLILVMEHFILEIILFSNLNPM